MGNWTLALVEGINYVDEHNVTTYMAVITAGVDGKEEHKAQATGQGRGLIAYRIGSQTKSSRQAIVDVKLTIDSATCWLKVHKQAASKQKAVERQLLRAGIPESPGGLGMDTPKKEGTQRRPARGHSCEGLGTSSRKVDDRGSRGDGDHIARSMTKDYYTSLLSLCNVKENTNSLSTTGTKRPPITTGELLDSGEHSTYRTIVGKLLWMCPLRPDIQYATKELTRAVQSFFVNLINTTNKMQNIYSGTYKEQESLKKLQTTSQTKAANEQ
eukprot:4338806-Amphidinium_carterae.3